MFSRLFPRHKLSASLSGRRRRPCREAVRRGRRQLAVESLEDRQVLAAVVIVESGGTTDVEEGGPTDTYDIQLDTVPAGNIEITVTACIPS